MSKVGHRQCGAVYRRTESMAKSREIASFRMRGLRIDAGKLEHGLGTDLSLDRWSDQIARGQATGLTDGG
jgi:hypothetical protein